ncbi:MAG: sigma-70 family RNA polymerase sigma factor [Bacteroidales bacterium]|nr:sigma-70 family RNA polymerase sigma factor [Bacteroidales bacterium]
MTGQTSAMMALRDPDIRLMLRVRADDPHAFAELVEQYQHRLIAVMHHLVGNREEAEDLAQEVFLRVYRNRASYTPKAKFSTWLFKIANNLALNAHRDRRRRPVVPLEPADSQSSGHWPTQNLTENRDQPPTERIQQQELEQIIRVALDDLNERQRLAVVLNKFEDMGYQEIAEVMGLTPPAVKSLLSRAREKLRAALQPYIYMDAPPPAPPHHDSDHGENTP